MTETDRQKQNLINRCVIYLKTLVYRGVVDTVEIPFTKKSDVLKLYF